MTYLLLFWTFFKIGLFTIGGGHAMIPLIMQDVVARAEWGISQDILLDFIAISESTPGPFAVNIATYVGTTVGDAVGGIAGSVLGGICATAGVVLPSVIIIVLIVKLFAKHMQKPAVQEVFTGVRSTVSGLLLSVFITLLLTVLFGISSIWESGASVDYIGIGLFAVLMVLANIRFKSKRGTPKKISPILIIVISAVLGLLLYGFIPTV